MTARSVAIYLPDLSGGGAERLHLQLAPALLARGLEPRFLLDRWAGSFLDAVPTEVRVDVLNAERQVAALPKLVRYLRKDPPDVLIANMEHMNIMATLARAIARAPTRIIATQHNAYSEQIKRSSLKWRTLPIVYRAVLPFADALVAVSHGVAADLAASTGLAHACMDVIHNGVIAADFDACMAEVPDHSWFKDTRPLIVGMGRLVPQKDFATLIRGFAKIRQGDTRLILLGEGPMRQELERLIDDLALSHRVSMPGFVSNPIPWLRRAQLFVLTSKFEGFGNVLAEALACGTPVVSTDCPHGPAEILQNGLFGTLVPVGNAQALCEAMTDALTKMPDRALLAARGRHFSVERCTVSYHALIDRLTQSR